LISIDELLDSSGDSQFMPNVFGIINTYAGISILDSP